LHFSKKINRIINQPIVASSIFFLFIITSSVVFLSSVDLFKPDPLDTILEKGEIIFLTRNNAHCYYLYQDEPMGFEFDLAKAFAEYLGVKLKIKVSEKWEEMIPSLKNEKAHVIAASFTITPKRKKHVLFSDAYMKIHQHLITGRLERNMKGVADLEGKKIYVRKGTSYQERLEDLQKNGLRFEIITIEDIATQDLIQQVANGEIDITIADTNIAKLARRYYPGVHVGSAISGEEHLAWAVNSKSDALLDQINDFFQISKENGTINRIYNKYYSDVDRFNYLDITSFHRRINSRLPKYVHLIKGASKKYGFDWRLVTAQIYQESHFRRWAKSRANAYGLMQLTRRTAKSLGVKNIYNPDENIYAGVRHLKNLYSLFDDAEGADRLFISLGAYNAGQGHIRDAQRLAKKLGLNPVKWSELSKALSLLSNYKYYKDAQYGYCRGEEPIQYVRQIMIYYDILKHQGIDFDLRPKRPYTNFNRLFRL
jgi:peptidoglycan lytic transglycosylase F